MVEVTREFRAGLQSLDDLNFVEVSVQAPMNEFGSIFRNVAIQEEKRCRMFAKECARVEIVSDASLRTSTQRGDFQREVVREGRCFAQDDANK